MLLRYFLPNFLILASLIISGCANKQIANQAQVNSIANEKAEQFLGDNERALNDAEAAYKKAKQAELEFYAPLHMEQVRTTLKQARTLELQGKQDESIQACAQVVALAEAGLTNKTKTEALLPDLIQQKSILDEIKAERIVPKHYQAGIEDFKELIHLIEAGEETKIAKASQSVLAELKDIELNTMLVKHWQPARDTLDKADNEDADSNAKKTFDYAEALVEQNEALIRQHYTDRELVAKAGKDALRAAQHSLYIGREVTLLFQMNKPRAEQAALTFEDHLHNIGSALNADDLRHMSLQDQTLALKQLAAEQEMRIAARYQKQIAELEAYIEEMEKQQSPAQAEAAVTVEATASTEVTASTETAASTKTTASAEVNTIEETASAAEVVITEDSVTTEQTPTSEQTTTQEIAPDTAPEASNDG